MEQPPHLAIVHRYPAGQLAEYAPNSPIFAYVASTIKLAVNMLSCPQGCSALVRLALGFDASQSSTWYHGFSKDSARAKRLVDAFLSKITARFPLVVVDQKITDPRNLGFHPRGVWDGDFDPRDQAINLNAGRVLDMFESANRSDLNQFRTFQFLFANTILHEVGGHILITFLGQGRPVTPPQQPFSIEGYSNDQAGESGRTLETFLLGGTIEYYRDANYSGNDQPGIPHIVKGDSVFRITTDTIERTIAYGFRFPYGIVGEPTGASTVQNMGHPAPTAATATDPTIRNLLAHSSPGCNISKASWSILREVPVDPSIRVEAA